MGKMELRFQTCIQIPQKPCLIALLKTEIYSAGQNDDILIVNPQLIQFSRFLKKVRYRKIIAVENYDIASLTAKQLGCHALLPEPAVAGSKFRLVKQLDIVDIKLVYREQNRNHPIIKLIKETLAEKTL